MRRASGLIQSTLRTWSSFSAVPALMGDVPLFSIQGGDSFKSRAVPYDLGLISQYTALRGEEAAFVARVLQGPLRAATSAGPTAAPRGRSSSPHSSLVTPGPSRHAAVLARATDATPHRALYPLYSQLRLGNGSRGLTSAHAQALVGQAAVPAFANGSVPTLEEVYWTNERFRAQVAASFAAGGTGWLNPRQLNTSVFNYGLTRNPLAYVSRTAKPVGAKPIEHDLLTYLAGRVHASAGRLDYLEIGVSVLKSFDTQVHYHSNASFTALDVEDPNWMRAARWGEASSAQSRPSSGIRKTKGRTIDHLYEWSHVPTDRPLHAANRVRYVEGDALRSEAWSALAALKARETEPPFNVVLSDGLHQPHALLAEMRALLEHGLVGSKASTNKARATEATAEAVASPFPSQHAGQHAPHVLIAWDDCSKSLRDTVEGPVRKLFLKSRPGSLICYAHVLVNGWVGEIEAPHGCCLLSTFDLREWLQPNHAAPPESSTPTAKYARDVFASARAGLTCKTLET